MCLYKIRRYGQSIKVCLHRIKGCHSMILQQPRFDYQKSPLIFPLLSQSIFIAAGALGRPGIIMISPVRATTKPAPAESFTSLTVMVKFSGLPSFVGSSERLYCVFATQIGVSVKPRRSISAIALFA